MPVPDPAAPLCIESLDMVPTRTVEWLWPGRLARGKLAIFDGDPGLGKSMVTLDLCARITTGRPFPDECPGPAPANVLLFHGEDTAEDVVNPRLRALGADCTRVFHVYRQHAYGPEPLCFPAHLDQLEQTLQEVRPLLVVVDPITGFLDSTVCTGNDPSVRRVLGPLAQLADKYDCVIILIRHLNKNAGKRTLYRGAGSMAFLAVCRSAWLFAKHPGKPTETVMAEVKNNLAPPQESLAYEVLGGLGAVPVIHWLEACSFTAPELLQLADRALPAASRAREFLLDFLKDGPRPTAAIWEAALELGLGRSTVYAARNDANVITHHTEDAGKTTYYWALAKHPPPLSSDPDVRTFEEQLHEVRANIPPRNPLDEPE